MASSQHIITDEAALPPSYRPIRYQSERELEPLHRADNSRVGPSRTTMTTARAPRQRLGPAVDRSSALWTVLFLLVALASWLAGAVEIALTYRRQQQQHRVGSEAAAAHMVHGLAAVGEDGRGIRLSIAAAVLAEAVYFVLGFVALCVAACFLTLEKCSGRMSGGEAWDKHCKEV